MLGKCRLLRASHLFVTSVQVEGYHDQFVIVICLFVCAQNNVATQYRQGGNLLITYIGNVQLASYGLVKEF